MQKCDIMKPFKELGLTSKVFTINKSPRFLPEKDQYGNVYVEQVFSEHPVNRIENVKGCIEINRTSYDHKLVIIPEENIGDSIYQDNYQIYVSDENLLKNTIKDMVVKRIRDCENNIIQVKKQKEAEIINLRQSYHDYLNSLQ